MSFIACVDYFKIQEKKKKRLSILIRIQELFPPQKTCVTSGSGFFFFVVVFFVKKCIVRASERSQK